MNKRLTCIIFTLGLLLFGFTATAQVTVGGNVYGGGNAAMVGGSCSVLIDQDGASITNDVYGGGALAMVNTIDGTSLTDGKTTTVTLTQGTVVGGVYGGGLGDLASLGGDHSDVAANVFGPVQVFVYGGSATNVFGCNNLNGTPKSSVEVFIYGSDPTTGGGNTPKVYAIKGVFGGGNEADYDPTTPGNYPTVAIYNCATSIENVYGGGNAAAVPYTNVTVNGGDIGRVFGGGNGERGSDFPAHVGRYTASDVTYGSGNTNVTIHGGTIGQVFGGSNANGVIKGAISVSVAKEGSCAIALGELYGGGNLAPSQVGSITIGCMETADMIDYVYGGSNDADITGNINLTMTGGRVGNLFGGNNTGHTISGSITVNVNWDGSCSNNYLGNVYGGGNKAQYTSPNDNQGNPTYPHVNIYNGTVSGNVYGGGKGVLVDGPQHGVAGKVTGNPQVTIGDSDENHTVTVVGDVYGGGDAATVAGTPVIEVNDCNTEIGYLYGGGNAADVNGTNITFNAGTVTHDAFGGGHGDRDMDSPRKYADVHGNVVFNVYGGSIDRVFAGSNSKGEITGSSTLTINKTSSCDMIIREVYGGGNEASGNAGTISIGCTGDLVTGDNGHAAHPENIGISLEGIGSVYGGANQANIGASGEGNESNITLNINSGIVGNVYGGNNTSGTIYGDIEVNIEKTSDACGWYVGNVYGGGNLAQYTGAPAVNIKNGTVSINVYGGGKGDPDDHTKGQVTGNPVVTIGDISSGHDSYVAAVTGDVYGGGDAGNVVGTPQVNVVNKCTSTIGNVYGGGNAADVNGTDVNIDGGIISGMVFGGGHGNNDPSDLKVADVNGPVDIDITGGTIAKVFAGSNLNGSISGTITLDIDKSTASGACDMKIGEVYGGGNEASGNAGTITIGCTGDLDTGDNGHAAHPENIGISLEGIGSVYGGANQANIGTSENHSDITLNINSGMVGNVYGGNNTSGTIYGDIEVNIEKTSDACGWYVGNVYGGGNLAQYTGGPAVNVYNGTVSGNVYGGGKGLASDHSKGQVTGNPVVTIGDNSSGHGSYEAIVSGSVFGGGDAGNVEGTPVVNVVEKCNTTITTAVYGGGNAADVSATNVTINGGTIGDVFGGGNGAVAAANVAGATGLAIHGGTINRVFAGGNTSGTIGTNSGVTIDHTSSCNQSINEVYGGGNLAAGNAGTIAIGCTAENIGDVYGGANKANITNNIELIITGGQINNVYGGNNTGGEIPGTIKVKVNKDSSCSNFSLGNVFGGGNMAVYSGTPEVKIINGTVSGNVFGGGNKAGVAGSNVEMTGGVVLTGVYGGCKESGTVTGTSLVKIYGGDVGSSELLNATIPVVAQVFGGGLGEATWVNGDVEVNIGDATHAPSIYGDVYGGSALGQVNDAASDETTVNILNGTLYTHQTTVNNFPVYNGGNVYGGGLGQKDDPTTTESELVEAKVFGTVTVNIGALTGSLDENGFAPDGSTEGKATIGGSVYGCNNAAGSPQENVTVNIYKTAHTTANEYGAVEIPGEDPTTYAIANVFGGGNEADFRVDGKTAQVNIYGCDNTIRRTFGGGNAAATNDVNTWIQGGRIYQVFGGGNGEVRAANIYGDLHLDIHGGNVGQFYGASNQQGNITGTINVNVDNASPCPNALSIDEFFCGGNFADINGDLETTIDCSGGMTVNNLYGGCNQALIHGHVILNLHGGTYINVFGGSKGRLAGTNPLYPDAKSADIDEYVILNLYGGSIENVYGGSNILGNIYGSITVNVIDEESSCPLYITNIYGGSNLTDYKPTNSNITSPVVNVIHADNDITGNVYGGSKGETGSDPATEVKSNPLVNIGYDATSMAVYLRHPGTNESFYTVPTSSKTTIQGSVFGGGDAAEVLGNTKVFLRNRAKVFGNVYGGGNMGEVKDNPDTVEVEGNTKVIVNGITPQP